MPDRKTRFVCIADTHNASPRSGAFKLPEGDVLIHAGDLTKQGTCGELEKTLKWIADTTYEVKIIVAGNHDRILDKLASIELGDAEEQGIRTLLQSDGMIYLAHEMKTIQLQTGPRTVFSVFGSPRSPSEHGRDKFNAFCYNSEEGQQLWQSIPDGVDIVVTHTPPNMHCDIQSDGLHMGCDHLRRSLWRVRPRLAVSGHIHEARGYDRVLWDLHSGDEEAAELKSTSGIDNTGSSKRQFRIDLTSKSASPLDHSGDTETGKKETCIINAAIMASSWPYQTSKMFNKPIVVDIDLPTWEDDIAPI